MSSDNINLYAGQHAIEVVNFSVILGIPLDTTDNNRFETKISQIREHFPYTEDTQTLLFAIGPEPSASPPPPPGKELACYSNDGRKEWSGQFINNAIVVSCHQYTN